MNSKTILLIASVLIVAASSISNFLPVPVHAATIITLNPTKGITGSQATITGTGFAGQLAIIYWDDKELVQNAPISKTGEINYSFAIPSSPKGDHFVKVADDSNIVNISAPSAFSVTPSVAMEPPWGKPTNTLPIFGYGFPPGEAGIKPVWGGKPTSTAPATADKNGAWYSTIQVPNVAKGEYIISAMGDSTTENEVADIVFTVSPFCKATPLSGPAGTKVMISGVGFRRGEDGVTFTWDGPIIDTNFIAKPDGSFSWPITVPPSVKGSHIIGIYGSSFTPKGIVPDIEFEVTPSIDLTPSSLINSRDLEVDGNGFNANESVTISYDKSDTGISATTDALGSFSTKFQVPLSPNQNHQVTATGSKGALAQANYTSMLVSPVAPQLLFPVPGAKIQAANSIFDAILSGQKTGDTTLTTMNWDVTGDQSNLKYTLQISRTQDFSNVLFTKDGIQTKSYNLSKSSLASAGMYYWRVEATNESGGVSTWSNSWTFEILPASALILTIDITIIILLIATVIFGVIALMKLRW